MAPSGDARGAAASQTGLAMHIVRPALPVTHCGVRSALAVDPRAGISAFEIRLLTLEPGVHGPVSQHAGELAVVVLAGSGKLVIDGGPTRFTAPCSLLIPPGEPYQIVNNGSAALQLVSVFTDARQAVAPRAR